MKKILFVSICCLMFICVKAQQQTYDLLTFTPPKGWKKEMKQNLITYTKIDNAKKTWCVIGIIKSTTSKGNIDADLESEWNELAVKQYNADSMQASATEEVDGWKIKAASGKFITNNKPSAALLTTFSGYNRCISILATTNSQNYLEAIQNFIGSVDIKKPTAPSTSNNNQATMQQPVNITTGSSSGFRYTISNFDDGWTAKEESDWVKVTKGNITVLLHYAKEGTVIAADPEPKVNNAWNILVAPRYSNLRNYKIASPSLDQQRAYLGAGTAIDKSTGKEVFVSLFRKGSGGWIEFITPDKNTFIREFGLDINQIGWDAESSIWAPLLKMANYNKFAVAASDLTGKWASWSGAGVEYVNIYTGAGAGMGHAQSGNEIVFSANGTYNREYKGVSGSPGGANQYYGEKTNGKAIVTNWEVQLTNSFKGATHAFTAQFEAVKGGRILHLWRGNIEEMHMYKTK